MKIIVPLLLLATVLAAPCVSGCANSGAVSDELTREQLQQLLSDSVLAMKNVSTLGFNQDMNMDMSVTGGSDPGEAKMNLTSEGVQNSTSHEMQMTMEMSTRVNASSEKSSQDVTGDIYMLQDWIYMKLKMAELGEKWVKMPVSEEMENAYDMNVVNDQLALIESYTEVQLLKHETVENSECYVLNIVPDVVKLMQWAMGQQGAGEEFSFNEIAALKDAFKELNYIMWIVKDTKYVKKVTLDMRMEMNSGQMGTTGADFDNMTMNIEFAMLLRDYNNPVSIVLPDEALNAQEMTQ
jgi:outer membrane murein-binding lipoprotein Lpp